MIIEKGIEGKRTNDGKIFLPFVKISPDEPITDQEVAEYWVQDTYSLIQNIETIESANRDMEKALKKAEKRIEILESQIVTVEAKAEKKIEKLEEKLEKVDDKSDKRGRGK